MGDYDNNGYEDLYITAYGLISCTTAMGSTWPGKPGMGWLVYECCLARPRRLSVPSGPQRHALALTRSLHETAIAPGPNLPKRGALLYGSEAAERRVSPEPLVCRLLNRSDQQERRTERHIAQKGERSDQSNHAVSRTPRRERSHWPKVSFRCLNWSGNVMRSRLSTSHLRPSQAGSARTAWPVKSR